jgi:sugar phosphate permease
MSDNHKSSNYRYLIFLILSLAYLLVYFHRLCAAVVAVDIMEDLNAGGALIGILAAAYFYPYALMQLPAGLLSDSLGPRRSITIFFFVAFAGSVILSIAPDVVTAIIGRTLVGVGVAMLFVPAMKILAEWFAVREFAFMTGILIAVGGTGTLIATSPLAWLSGTVGWRNSFLLVGFVTLLLTGLIYAIVRDRPEEIGVYSPKDNQRKSESRIPLFRGMRMVLRSPYFWPLGLWFFFTSAIFFSFGGLWGGPYLMQVYGMTKTEAGGVLSMLAFGMIAGSPTLSFFSDRIIKSRKAVLIVSSILSLAVIGTLTLQIDSLATSSLYVLCFLMGMFSNAIVVIGFTSAKELFPLSIAGTATGLINLFPFAGGAIFQPILGHILESRGRVLGAFTTEGYRMAFLTLTVCGILALFAVLFTKDTFPVEGMIKPVKSSEE